MTLLKAIVACLALANVGYFLWQRGIDQSHAVPSAASSNSLKLASEMPALRSRADAGGLAAAGGGGEAGAGLATNVGRCVTVGPFKDVSEASHAASTLRSGGYDPRQRVVEGEVWAGLWVYLPIPATRPASDQLLAKLKTAGIEDALEMPGPADASVLSLGLFGDQKRAQARVSQMQSLGLNPGIADRRRTGNTYWIDIDLKPTDGALNSADLQGEGGHINRLEVKACPADAAPELKPAPAAGAA